MVFWDLVGNYCNYRSNIYNPLLHYVYYFSGGDSLDFLKYFQEYIGSDDAPTTALNWNSNNSNKSPNHLNAQLLNPVLKNIGSQIHHGKMTDVFGKKDADKFWSQVRRGILYFHDQDKMFLPYCFAASTSVLAANGRPYGQLQSLPPKRADSFVAQVIEYTMDLSQEFAGAIALGDFFVEYAKFSLKEHLTNKVIQNDYQKFVHVVNNSFRVGGDSPFTNVSIFDKPLLKQVFKIEDPLLLDEVIHVQKVFGEFFAKKNPQTGMPYRFPICTVNMLVKDGEIVDKEFLDWVSIYGKTGVFNIYLTEKSGKIASCCRLINDVSLMSKDNFFDSFGNGGMNIGSHRVITLNLPRMRGRKGPNFEKKRYCMLLGDA
jgi:ribonucleoside-triphosphate reductase (formate)